MAARQDARWFNVPGPPPAADATGLPRRWLQINYSLY